MPVRSQVHHAGFASHDRRFLWRAPLSISVSITVMTAVITGAALLSGPASADVKSDKANVTQLEQRIAEAGTAVQQSVSAYDLALAHKATVDKQVAVASARVTADQRREAQAMGTLRAVALSTYMTSTDDSVSLAVFSTRDVTSLAARQEYARVATAGIRDAIDTVTIDEQKTRSSETALHAEQLQAAASVQRLDKARLAAQTTLAQDDLLLSQAKDNLAAVQAALARQAAEEKQAEEALAQGQGSHPVSFAFNPTPGAYTNPLRAINDLSPKRVDQGVDYSGYGPIFAVGDGVILSTTNSGWPGGTFISYRLTDGPAGGLVVYAAEDIYPSVSVGQSVNAGTVLGTMYEGPDGIETGWADRSGEGTTMANDAGQFNGSNSTAYGANFSQMLSSLGAPPGMMQNNPPTGSLPPNWPTW